MRTIRHFGLSSSSRLYSCISPDFIGGKMMGVRASLLRTQLSWETPSNRPLRNVSPNNCIDLLAVVPSQMLDLTERFGTLPQFRHIIIGGAPLHRELRAQISHTDWDAWETYGMTETASHVALRRITETEGWFEPLEGVSVSCKEDNRLVVDIAGWKEFETNDIAEFNGKGGFRILGRADNVIISGGKKIHPERIENILEPLLGHEVLAYGKPDSKWGEALILLVEATCDIGNDEIEALCRRELNAWEVPKHIERGQIPRTQSGKKKRG